ncbi:MAG: MBL fold metallo-hydrolase [Caldilineaceae bacterium]|nr:MBL fold metallo-hydrolase [Caldilineaceae bacterium]
MAYTVTIGATRCHILSDGLHRADGGGFFGLVPRTLWSRTITPNDDNQVPCDARCLLIEAENRLILVDTGNGDKMTEKQRSFIGLPNRDERLIGELRRVGFEPDDIDLVVMTHFHGDHIGGNTRFGADGETVIPTFPNALHIAQRIDLAEASFPNERTRATYDSRNWEPLMEAGRLEIVDGPQQVDRVLRTEISPGHTQSIQVIWVEDGGESLCFLTDACSWAVHMDRLAWVPSFDLDPMTSIETKRRLRFETMRCNALLVFQHDPCVVTGRLVPGKRDPVVAPEITEDAWFDPTE